MRISRDISKNESSSNTLVNHAIFNSQVTNELSREIVYFKNECRNNSIYFYNLSDHLENNVVEYYAAGKGCNTIRIILTHTEAFLYKHAIEAAFYNHLANQPYSILNLASHTHGAIKLFLKNFEAIEFQLINTKTNGKICTSLGSPAFSIHVLGNGSDLDVSDCVVSLVKLGSTKGIVTVNVNNQIDYEIDSKFDNLLEGQIVNDSFMYKVSDNNGHSRTEKINIKIIGTGSVPIVVPETDFVTAEDTSIIISANQLFTNDMGYTDTSFSVIKVDNKSAGGAFVSFDGQDIIYNPAYVFNYLKAGETTFDSFTYEIQDNWGNVNTKSITIVLQGVVNNENL